MINLKFMNDAVEIAEGNEFRLLYVIANTISLKKEGHTKIYRDMLADKLGLSTKQITRLTNALVEKGLLKKDLVSENGKTVCYYSLNLDKNGLKSTTKLDKNVPLNKSEKDIIKEKRNNKNEKDEIEEKKKEFKTACGVEEEMETELDEVGISDENDFNWNDEIVRFKAKVGRTKNKEELLNISRDFNPKMNDFNYPIELEKELEGIKRTVSSRMYSLSM